MDVVGINVFPHHLLQIVFKVSITSETRLGIAEFRDESFFYVKNQRNPSDFFSFKNIKKGAQVLFLT